MIPDEAIQAVAKVMAEANGEEWVFESPLADGAARSATAEIYLSKAHEALAAALPYLNEAARHQRRAPTDWPDLPKARP